VREPLLWPAIAMLLGIAGGRALHLTRIEALTAAGAFLLITAITRWLTAAHWRFPALALAMAAGAVIESTARPGPRPQLDAGRDEVLSIEGCVVEPSTFFEGRLQFVVELEPGARARVYQYPKGGQPPVPLPYGQRVAFSARVRRPGSFDNPGGFDYQAYLARHQIFWIATIPPAAKVAQQPGECGGRLATGMARARAVLLGRLEAFFPGDGYASGMMQALLLGDTSHVKRLWTDDFRRTGTFHALVISGQHVVVLTAGWVWIIFQITRRRWMAALAGVLLAWIYAGLAGGAAPVLRAAWGLTFYAGAGYFYRGARVLNIVAAVALVFIVFDPGQAYDASFQLSFLAVLAIGALAVPAVEHTTGPFSRASRSLNNIAWDVSLPPQVAAIRVELRLLAETISLWTRLPQRWANALIGAGLRFLATAAEMLVVTAMVQAALALPLIAYFHRFPVTGLLSNLLIALPITLAIPAGMLAVVTNWAPLAKVAAWLVQVSGKLVEWSAQWEPSWRIPAPPLWLAAALILALAGLAVSLRTGRRKFAAWAAATAMLALLLWHPFAPDLRSGELELTAVDVGQGDGLLMVLPDGRTIGIDAGGTPSFRINQTRRTSGIDTGEDVIAPYLWTRSIRRLDVLVLTHAHTDHMGGLSALIENFRPGEIWTGLMPAHHTGWQAIEQTARRHGTRIKTLHEGDRFGAGSVLFDILAPAAGGTPGEQPHNNDSLAMLVTYGQRRFLLTGDLERAVEQRLVEGGTLPHIDVLKVGHHGSRTSTTLPWLDTLRPSVAIISAGRDNRYRHPHPQVLERLAARGIVTLRTDELGLVTVRTNGRWLDFDSFRWRQTPGSLLPAFSE
jgi:competence protein ComEC